MKTVSHEYYVDLEVAKLLKDAGFDWECCYCYDAKTKDFLDDNEGKFNFNEGDDNDFYSAPTLDVVQRWLREIKCIHLYVRPILDERKYVVTVVVDDLTWGQVNDNTGTAKRFNTYEEAQESGIKKALEIILEKR